MRGKRKKAASCAASTRITPADAGKTLIMTSQYFGSRDHPRGCGENPSQAHQGIVCLGSPPRMRGKLDSLSRNHAPTRITPADAGKTPSCTTFAPLVQDHPRGCGENRNVIEFETRLPGSPPRMRGKRHCSEKRGAFTGITPADAGKTCSRV